MRIGIDIGTDVARVARLNDQARPQLLRFADGTTTIPNAIRQTMHGLLAGQAANQTLIGNSETTVLGCTRLMGNASQLPQQVLLRSPYPVRIQQFEATCDLLYAEQPASALFGALLDHVIEQAQRLEPIESVVLTVPASADHRYRVQARQAAEERGITVTRLINQPTAAVVAAELPASARTVLVANINAHICEVSLARREQGVRILATVNQQEGGDTWTWHVADQLAQRLDQNGITIQTRDLVARLGLHRAASDIIETLSLAPQTMQVLDHIGGFGRDALLTIQRSELDSWLATAMKVLTDLTRRGIQQAKIRTNQIDAVILIGEYSHLPQVQKAVFSAFNRHNPPCVYAPDLAAKGAAILTASDQTLVWDVTPYPLGISCYYRDVELFSPIIQANTPIPTPTVGDRKAFTETYWTREPDQTRVSLDVLQYRGGKTVDFYGSDPILPHECEELATWDFNGLHPKPGQTVSLTVTFAIDQDGILHLFADETGKNHTLSAQMKIE